MARSTSTFGVIGAALLICSPVMAQVRGPAVRVSAPNVARASAEPSARIRTVSSATRFQRARLGAGIPSGHITSSLGSFHGVHNPSRRGYFGGPAVFVPLYAYPYGAPYYDDSSANVPPQQDQPQQADNQQPAANDQQDAAAAENIGLNAIPPQPAAPVRDIGDFVLVQNDGRVLFASAFYVAGTELTYVTPEGIRHTLPVSNLDADATQQMNEARGTAVQIHN